MGSEGAPTLPSLDDNSILTFHLDYSFADLLDCYEATSHGCNQPCLPRESVECAPRSAPRSAKSAPRGVTVRVLTAPMVLYASSTMSMSMEPAPGSPPELTNSLSSKKSSSYNSSSLSDSAPNELAHFEDISLDDLPNAVFAKSNSYVRRQSSNGSLKRGFVSDNHTRSFRRSSNKTGAQPPLRLLTDTSNNKRVMSAVKSNSGRPLHFGDQSPRKRITSSPNPFLPPSIPPGKRSRSISPSPTQPFNPSPLSFHSPHSPRRLSASGTWPTQIRRSSWQPGRKTIKELEDEYDDKDEELPEDAVVWNIPISPRPPRERSSSPTKSDTTPSPRDSGMSLTRTSSEQPTGLGLSIPSKPLALSRSVSVNVPLDLGSVQPHTKSWDAAMSDLSAEARMLTAALEAFASERDKAREDAVQSGGSSRLSSSSEKRLVSSSMVELPPLRRGDIMIDPLPVSKEKEAVLTRTRPSWLPPKSQKEEKRHLREYARMMASAKEAERRREERVRRERVRKDREMGSLNRIWEQHVLPNWARCVNEPGTRELWWRGVSPRSRGEVWSRAVGNELGLTEKSFEAALERTRECERRLLALSEEQRGQEREWAWLEEIRRDVKTAYPDLKIFQPGGPLHDAFVELLMAYAFYRSDVGYVSGIHVSSINLPHNENQF